MFRKKKLPRSPRAVLKSNRFGGINQVSRLIEALRKQRFRGVFLFLAGPPFVFCLLLLMSWLRPRHGIVTLARLDRGQEAP